MTITHRQLSPEQTKATQTLNDQGLHPLLAKLYAARGVGAAEEVSHELKDLLDFNLLLGIDQAVERLLQALQQQERILIVGDFDADGATSTALAVSALTALGAQHVDYLVPNRFDYGYGLTPEIVEVAAERHPKLIITVDNGISSVDGVARANTLGIDVLITDHHLPGTELPQAVAMVNPNQHGDTFPSKHLAGVGVIFYTLLALRSALRSINWFVDQDIPEPNMAEFLDLVALGTVADVVVLDRNNRILVQQGLRRIRAGKHRPGIAALLKVAERDCRKLLASDLGFAVAPRLNAAGRLEDMTLGIACLLCQNPVEASVMAKRLDELNLERRQIEQDMHQQAVVALAKLQLDKDLPLGLCLFDETWHQGVIGILAGRLKDLLHRPVIVFTRISATELKASARSVAGLHIRDALDSIAAHHPGLLIKFGGHAMAAGLSLEAKHYRRFCEAFNEEVGRRLNMDDLQHRLLTDGELLADSLHLEMAETLQAAGPWGQGFPEPLFDGVFRVLEQRIVGQNHLKMRLGFDNTAGNTERGLDAIAFRVDLEQWPNYRCTHVHLAYRLAINEFRGLKKVQLVVEYIAVVER